MPAKGPASTTLRTVAAPTVKLEVLEGDRPGQVFALAAGTHIIGRSKEAAICLFDAGASRRHAEIEVSMAGVILRDLASGNGTLVNDAPADEVALQPGDELQIGGHRFRVGIEGGAGVPARVVAAPVPSLADLRAGRGRNGPKARASDRLLLLMAALGGVAVLLTAFALTRSGPRDTAAEQRARHVQAKQVFREGLDAFRAENWDQALLAFEKVLTLHPAHEDAARYLKATREEKEATRALDEAEGLLSRGDLVAAATALDRISPQSILSPKVDAMKARIDRVKLAGTLDALQVEITNADPVQVMALIELPATATALERAKAELDALQSIDLGPAEALLQTARQKAPKASEISSAADRLQQRRAGIESAIEAKKEVIKDLDDQGNLDHAQQVRAAIERTMRPVRVAFDAGRFPEVARLLRAGPREGDAFPEVKRVVRAARAALPRFKESLERARRSEKAKDLPAAADRFTKALVAAGKIHPGGKRARAARASAVRMRYLAGRAAFNQAHWSEAFAHWSKGNRLDPDDTNLKKGLVQLDAQAEQIYLQAYVQKPTMVTRARVGFKKVLEMSPATSEWNRKARTQLETMGGL